MHEFELPTDVDCERLVDRALNDAEERELLARLEETPGGWRRLALAFCEDRALRSALTEFESSKPTTPSSSRAPSIPSAPSTRRKAWGVPALIGLAALLVGLGTGLAWNGGSRGELAERDVPALRGSDVAVDPDADAPRFETLEMLVDDGHVVRRLQVPVVAASEAKLDWMDVERPVVPAEVREAFEAAGHEVAESRRFLRVPIDAEHDALVPVGEFSVQRVEYQ